MYWANRKAAAAARADLVTAVKNSAVEASIKNSYAQGKANGFTAGRVSAIKEILQLLLEDTGQ